MIEKGDNFRLVKGAEAVGLAKWWPEADRVLEKRGRRGISPTDEAYARQRELSESRCPALPYSRWGYDG